MQVHKLLILNLQVSEVYSKVHRIVSQPPVKDYIFILLGIIHSRQNWKLQSFGTFLCGHRIFGNESIKFWLTIS